MKIFKYKLEINDVQHISMQEGAKILTVQTQQGRPCLWALVDPDEDSREDKIILTFGTGHEILCPNENTLEYISTYQINNGALVFHVFEDKI